MTGIDIRHVEPDENTQFTKKEVRFNRREYITPFKALDFNDARSLRDISKLDLNWLRRNNVVEKSRSVLESTFIDEADKPDATYLSDSYDSYKRVPALSSKLILNTLTFSFNPLEIPDYEDILSSFLHIYHGRSDILFVPNLKVKRHIPEHKKSEIVIQSEDYLDYVNQAYDSLAFRNSKPIFVPLSTRFGARPFKLLVRDMVGLGYRYFWFDLEGRSSLSSAPQLRAFHEVISRHGLDDEVLLYGSNIRREINPHMSESACTASDVFSSPLGVDFIGVNREPLRGWIERNYTPPSPEETIPHKARIFDNENYEYVRYPDFARTGELFSQYGIVVGTLRRRPKFYSNFVNSFELNAEFDRQREVMLGGDSVMDYLGGKRSVSPDIMKRIEKVVSGRASQDNTSLNDFM